MLDILKTKKVIFFDVGYTLDYPASGDWMFTKKFYEIAGNKLAGIPDDEIRKARQFAMIYLEKNHLVRGTDQEYRQFVRYYSDISEYLKLELTLEETQEIAHDRTNNMDNYIAYSDAVRVVEALSHTHKLGVISDTWPSIVKQLKTIGVYDFFSSFTFSCDLGFFKPDKRIFLDALKQCDCRPEDAVFIDDSPENLEGAARLGITPILIAAHRSPAADGVLSIQSLSELIA